MQLEFNSEERVNLPSQREASEAWERQQGLVLVRVLGLKPYISPHGDVFAEPRYDLGEYGTKTALGVYRSLKRIIQGED